MFERIKCWLFGHDWEYFKGGRNKKCLRCNAIEPLQIIPFSIPNRDKEREKLPIVVDQPDFYNKRGTSCWYLICLKCGKKSNTTNTQTALRRSKYVCRECAKKKLRGKK